METDASDQGLGSIGNYDLLAKLGEGGMGTVYKAQHCDSGQIVAVKIVPTASSKNQVLLQRFENEFKAASAINHPNIVRAFEYCGTGNAPYLVMEFVDGETLGEKLKRERKLSEAEAVKIIVQICQGLQRAHKIGLIHRDVKPDNIMVARDGTAKLTDLGLVRDLDAELNLTKTGRGLGTPYFMAPEQFRNAKSADVRCDIYSVGATLYMTVTGELPFEKCSGLMEAFMKKVNSDLPAPRKLCPELSERIDWAIRRAMSPDPNLRPSSCREFMEDLTGHSTRKIVTPIDLPAQAHNLWYLLYKDEKETQHTVKGSTEGIRRSLKEKLLGDASNVRVSRNKAGPFEAILTCPEFCDTANPSTPENTIKSAGGATITARAEQISNSATAKEVAEPKASDSSDALPHIRFNSSASSRIGWLWTIFIAVAISATVVGAIYLIRYWKNDRISRSSSRPQPTERGR